MRSGLAEISALNKEVAPLKMERDILRTATVFAREAT